MLCGRRRSTLRRQRGRRSGRLGGLRRFGGLSRGGFGRRGRLRGDRRRCVGRVQHLVDDVDAGVLRGDAAALHLGGLVDRDVAARAGHLDLGALLGGALALDVVGAQQAQERVVVHQAGQHGRIGPQHLELLGRQRRERLVGGGEHHVRAVVEHAGDVDRRIQPAGDGGVEGADLRDAGQRAADRQVRQALPVGQRFLEGTALGALRIGDLRDRGGRFGVRGDSQWNRQRDRGGARYDTDGLAGAGLHVSVPPACQVAWHGKGTK